MTQNNRVGDREKEGQDLIQTQTEILADVRRFLEYFNRQDIDAVMAAMTENCVWESAFPLPDGTLYEGQDAVRSYSREVFRSGPNAVSESQEMIATADRCVVLLTRRWTDDSGKPQHFRGMGVFRFRGGKIAEYLVYHKRNRPVTIQNATAETLGVVQSFCEVVNRHDIDAVMAAMTDDCLMETLTLYPDGVRYEGKTAVRARWEEVFHSYPDLRYESEEMFAAEDRCILRWVGHRTGQDGNRERYRGVDIFRVRHGKIAEKLVYAKR